MTQSASHIVDSPFVTSSKMRHSPPPALNPTVPENEGPLDHITTYSSPFGDSSKLAETFDSTPIKQKKTVRSSAPPDRMMSLDSEQELAEAFSPTPPRPAGTRAKSSIDGPPQLSLATKRRMEAKALGSSQATPEAQKREKEAKLRKQSETDFKEAMMQLRANAEWNELSEALVTIQKTIGARPELIQDNLHDLTMALVAQVQNLRSSVAKIAISCFNDMFIALGKSMDTDLDVTVASILKKVGESGFLVDEATKCLNTMTKHVTNTRALTALLGQADHRNSVIRQRVSILLQMVIYSLSEAQASRLLSTMRDMERLLPVLVRFLREGLSETRNAARRSLFFLAKTSDFDKVAGKILSPSQAKEVQGAIDSVRSRGDGGMVPESSISPGKGLELK